jgi:polar amino acid transport system substrate-binding protein
MQPQRPEGPISAPSRRRRPTRTGLTAATSAVIAAAALAACGSSSSGGGSAATTSASGGASSTAAAATTTSGASSATSTSGGSSGTSTSGGSAASKSVTIDGQAIKTDPKLAAMLPAKIKSAGLVDITYNNAPPDEQVTNGKNVGWEIDLGQAVAATLGVGWHLTTSSNFDSFIPGLQNGRYNSSFTSFIQTPARLKQIDIVTYYNVGTGFAVKKGTSLTIKAPTDLCGHSVAVLEGSAFIQQIQSIKCGSKPAIKVQTFPSDSAAELAVSSGRDEVYSSSSDQLSYLIQQTEHQFVLQPLDFEPTPEGAGITKGAGLTKPVALAMDDLINSGAYAAIMKKWSITQGLPKKATVFSK